jgi:hypothetical protein
MKITIEIDDELLCTALFHDHPTPPAEVVEEREWIIDAWVCALLRRNGFSCRHVGTVWYTTNCPVKFNETYVLPDGHIIESQGTQLQWRRRL